MKKESEQKIIDFCYNIVHSYYDCNFENNIIKYFSDDFTYIGTYENDYIKNLAEAKLSGELEPTTKAIVTNEIYNVFHLKDNIYLCLCFYNLTYNKFDDPYKLNQRSTVIVEYTNSDLICLHIHNSSATASYLPNSPKYNLLEQQVKKQLEQTNRQMQVVLKTIKGGIKISRDDGTYSYIYVSDELCSLFGYTKDEFMEMSKGSAVGAVYPPDLQKTLVEVADVFSRGDSDYAVKYRIKCKDGSLKWVIDSGRKVKDEYGNVIINSFYLDITDIESTNLLLATQNELLKKEHERCRIAIQNTSIIIFDYDIQSDTYSGFGTLETFFKTTQSDVLERFYPDFLKYIIYQTADHNYIHKITGILKGETDETEAEIRIAPYLGSTTIIWAKIAVTHIYNEENEIIKTVGKLTNIQNEKEKEIELLEAQSKDLLTGAYNKEAGTRIIQQFMATKPPEVICGIMLLDMDNFAKLNSDQGTAFGDAVLQEVSDILHSETGQNDICVRLGGDEFMLFVKNCNKAKAAILGPHIAEKIKRIFMQNNPDVTISASIGMCVTEVVDEYSGLYQCAESTLKYVKENCRGTAACYLDTSNELGRMLTEIYPEKHFINDINKTSEHQEEDLISFALELLGKSKNLDDALFLLLSRIGRRYQFDRVSVFEIESDYLTCKFTYQWARNQADLQLKHIYYLTKEEIKNLSESYDSEGLNDNFPQKSICTMKSCLNSAMWDHGVYTGALCFERNSGDDVWSAEARKLQKELVKIISSFLLKARADAISQAKTDFLSRMSHEIRTPMNAISGMTTIAKSVLDDKTKLLNCLDKIEYANTYLLNLINDILDMSRIESGKIELNKENINLNEQMDNLEILLRPQAEAKKINLTFVNDYDTSRCVIADSLRLNQVLINIIGNAIKFTQNGGTVTVNISSAKETDETILFKFSVVDTGIGITPESIGRIFNAFEQADKSTTSNYGGTGLGLSISNRLVQMMGGNIEASSEPGKGSIFTFYLPLEISADNLLSLQNIDSNKTLTIKNDFEGKRILVVEDNELNCEIAESILKMFNFNVETAVNGLEGVNIFKNNVPYYYDAILMDIRMPIMDGLEAVKCIRTLGKSDSRTIPIIAMTANAFDEDSKKSLNSGMNGHLSKPIEVNKLLNLLNECFNKNESVDNIKIH